MANMGGVSSMLEKMPGMGPVTAARRQGAGRRNGMFRQNGRDHRLDDAARASRGFPTWSTVHQQTPHRERQRHAQIPDINRLLKQHKQMQKMMKKVKGGGMMKMMRSMKGMMPGGMR